MDLRTPTVLTLATASLLAAAIPALAAPSQKGDVTATTPFAWDGAGVTGFLGAGQTDDTLLNVTAAGKLTVALNEFSNADVNDIDVDVYKSNAAGEAVGDPIISGKEVGNEKVSKDVVAGFYLVQAYAFTAADATYKGKATIAVAETGPVETPPVGTPPATTPPAPTTDLLPEAKFGTFPKATKGKKLVLKGTAKDDKGVKAVEVAIVKVAGKKCTQLTSKGSFAKLAKCGAPSSFLKAKGTTAWSLTLKKGLPKGSYVASARAVDSAGQKQGGYSASNRKAFKVK